MRGTPNLHAVSSTFLLDLFINTRGRQVALPGAAVTLFVTSQRTRACALACGPLCASILQAGAVAHLAHHAGQAV